MGRICLDGRQIRNTLGTAKEQAGQARSQVILNTVDDYEDDSKGQFETYKTEQNEMIGS